MISIGTTHSYFSQNNKFNNYHYNRPFKILKYIVLRPLYFASLKLLTSGFPSVEMQFLLLKPISEVFLLPIIFFVILIQFFASCNLWPDIL